MTKEEIIMYFIELADELENEIRWREKQADGATGFDRGCIEGQKAVLTRLRNAIREAQK